MKKIISILLTLTMLGTMVTAALAKDNGMSDSEKFMQETETLIDLGILCGQDISSVKPFSKTKKYQLVNYIYSMFNDCDCSGSFSQTAAEFAASKGIIANAADLKTSDSLTVEMAAKMLVEALGYGAIAKSEGGWPSGYLSYARKLNLLDGVSAASSEDIQLHDLVKILYNAIDCNAAVPDSITDGIKYEIYKGGTILAYYRDIYKAEGQVTENYYTSLWGVGNVGKGQIVIDSDTYEAGATDAEEFVGYPVKAYYREGKGISTSEILHIEKNYKKCTEITIDAADVVDVDEKLTKVTYLNDTDAQKYASLENVKVICNGQLYADCTAEDLMGEKGTLTLIDSDNSGRYDIIRADLEETVLVDSINKTEKKITNKLQYTGALAELDINVSKNDGELSITNGSDTLSINDLTEWDVLLVSKSKGEFRPIINIRVCAEGMVGSVDSTDFDDESVVISGEKYTLSGAFMNAKKDNFKYAEIIGGREYTFYLNSDKEIVAAKITVSADMQVGYARKMVYDEDMDFKVYIRLFNEDQDWITYELAPKVSYNGKSRKAEDIYNLEMTKGGGSFEMGLVQYQLNDDNKIKKLETPIADNGNTESLRLRFKSINGQYRYNDNSIGSRYYLNGGKTNYWLIPSAANRDNETLYKLTTDRLYLEKDYNYDFTVYNLDEYNFSDNVTVVKDVSTETPSGNFFTVSKVVSEVASDGDLKQSIVGAYQNYDKMQLTAEEFGMFDDINPGDVLTVNPNQNAVIGSRGGYAVQYKIKDGNVFYNTDDLYTKFARMSGVIVKADGEKRRMMINNGKEIIVRRCLDEPYTVIYNKDTKIIERGSIGKLSAGDFIVYREFWGNITDIVAIREPKD